MKTSTTRFAVPLFLLAVILLACSGPLAIQPSATVIPTSTTTPLPTETPTATPTLSPTETPVPQPASLTGTIRLANGSTKPLVSLVQLRQGEGFDLVAEGETDSDGLYKIENIDPGTYELWVLITSKPAMLPGCKDVAPPDDGWKIGIMFAGDKALTMEHAYLSKALLLTENLQSDTLKAEGFFAVSGGFDILSGIENLMDVTLICK